MKPEMESITEWESFAPSEYDRSFDARESAPNYFSVPNRIFEPTEPPTFRPGVHHRTCLFTSVFMAGLIYLVS